MTISRKARITSLLGVLVLLALTAGAILVPQKGRDESHSSSTSLPDLQYLKAVNSVGPPKDPELLFLLMTQYVNANQQGEGVEFFSARLSEFEGRLTPAQKSLYLSIIGLLRAQHASSLSFLRRYSYVKETLALLDQAKQLSGGKVFVVNWIAAIVHTELPGFFGQRNAAREELTWCAENIDKAPHGCVRCTIISPNSHGARVTKPRHWIICGAVAIRTLKVRSHSLHRFQKMQYQGMLSHRGVSLKSFRAACTSSPVSSSRNTTLWCQKTSGNSSGLMRAQRRTPRKARMKRFARMHLCCRR